MTKRSEGRIITGFREMRNGRGLEQPRGAVVILIVASKPSKTRRIEPFKVFCKPFLQCGAVRFFEALEVCEKRDTLNDFSEMHRLDHTFRPPSFCRTDCLAVLKARGDASCGIDEPRM